MGTFHKMNEMREFYIKSIDLLLSENFPKRVRFTIQSGEAWSLKKEEIVRKFAEFGTINNVTMWEDKSSGTITFHNSKIAKKCLNQVVKVNECFLHTSILHCDLSPFPSGHQILIESDMLPTNWEKGLIIKDFFKGFGDVNAINIFGKNRLMVSFKDNIAPEMIGSVIKVPWDSQPVFVRE